jgi:hypothetical protein
MQVQNRFVDLLRHGWEEDYSQSLARQSWANIPILNEWKRKYPDRDPVTVHKQLGGTDLKCPGGGSYLWNERDQTMESTVFGSPTSPKEPKNLPDPFKDFAKLDAGITFQDNGLRARAMLDRKAEK